MVHLVQHAEGMDAPWSCRIIAVKLPPTCPGGCGRRGCAGACERQRVRRARSAPLRRRVVL